MKAVKKRSHLPWYTCSPEGNWFQWLKKELEKGMEVWLPQLPHAEQPSLREWTRYLFL